MDNWICYNHAAMPSSAPHELPDLDVFQNGEIWKIHGKPFFATWTSDFDCGYETGWWYCICKPPFQIELLSKSARRNVRVALRRCRVDKINPIESLEDMYRVYKEAITRYSRYDMQISFEDFCDFYNNIGETYDIWGCFNSEDSMLIGYSVCKVYETHCDIEQAKYSTNYLKLGVSDALNYTLIDYYLNVKRKEYVNDGSRSIVHDTNVQEYYERRFNFKKAYCKLHIRYRKPFGVIVKALYPFRNILYYSHLTKLHKVGALLKMEEISRVS